MSEINDNPQSIEDLINEIAGLPQPNFPKYYYEKAINTAYLSYRKHTGENKAVVIINSSIGYGIKKDLLQKGVSMTLSTAVNIDTFYIHAVPNITDWASSPSPKIVWYQKLFKWFKRIFI